VKVGTFISGWLADAARGAREAETLGYDFVTCDETEHDSMLTMAAAASSTQRVELHTAVTVAFARSPMVLAIQAWDIQQLSRGRLMLGLGSQQEDHLERRFSTPWTPPAPRMKEYVQCLRAIWDTFQHEAEPQFAGRHYRFQLMPRGYSPGPIEAPRPRVFVGAARPAMARVAGEVADGLPYVRITDKYMREVVLPNIKAGLERGGRTWADIEITDCGLMILGEDEREIEQGLERARRRIAMAFSPGSQLIGPIDEIFELHGWSELRARLRALAANSGLEDAANAIPDEVLRELVQTSTFGNLPDFIRQHREYARRMYFAPPIRSEAEKERFRFLLPELQNVQTPGVPRGMEMA